MIDYINIYYTKIVGNGLLKYELRKREFSILIISFILLISPIVPFMNTIDVTTNIIITIYLLTMCLLPMLFLHKHQFKGIDIPKNQRYLMFPFMVTTFITLLIFKIVLSHKYPNIPEELYDRYFKLRKLKKKIFIKKLLFFKK